jgi:uncharacterized SAM-binding protein YcdF (DUF218 family)
MSADKDAEVLFDYENLDENVSVADAIVGLGSHDIHVAYHAAELYGRGLAPLVIFSGGWGRLTKTLWSEPEASRFASVAMAEGVPADAIAKDTSASNTGENISGVRAILEDRGINAPHVIVVDRPYRLRRTRAAFEAQWPGLDFQVSGPDLSFRDYLAYYEDGGPIDMRTFISLLAGDLQRIVVYGNEGIQSKQEIPQSVKEAFNRLVEAGYTSQLLKQGPTRL